MNIAAIIHVLSALLLICGAAIASASAVSAAMGDAPRVSAFFLFYSLFLIGLSFPVFKCSKRDKRNLGVREGFAIVTLGWLVLIVAGAFPFKYLADFRMVDAFFETTSGFSTTGASIIDSSLLLSNGSRLEGGLESLPKGLIYWRSMTHWLGGMGVIVLFIAIMPYLGVSGKRLYEAEVSTAGSSQLALRIRDAARILWAIYIVFSVAETLLLMAGGMSLFDAWCHTCGTLATGGFSTRSASVSAYDSAYIESVIIIFMFMGSTNFVLHHRMFKEGISAYFKDEEFRSNLLITLLGAGVIAFSIYGKTIVDAAGRALDGNIFNSARHALFQTVSIKSCTGFVSADSDRWPDLARFILLMLMLVGGCAGSTTGAIKHVRVILLAKYSVMQIKKTLFPHMISNVTLNNTRVESETLHKVLAFFFVYLGLCAVSSLLLCTQDGNDILTSVSATFTCMGGVGPGFGKVGAVCTYSWMSGFSKIVLSVVMLLGRLEIFTLLVLFLPTFWKK